MQPQILFGVSVVSGFVFWTLVATYAVWPALRDRPRAEALRPLLILHSSRFAGLSFLITGVVSPDLPSQFAFDAAYGDVIAALLALAALATLRTPLGLPLVWIFNIWGSLDLINAFYQGNATGLQPGQLGAAYFIPTMVVPLLFVTHILIFRLLLQTSQRPSERYVTQ